MLPVCAAPLLLVARLAVICGLACLAPSLAVRAGEAAGSTGARSAVHVALDAGEAEVLGALAVAAGRSVVFVARHGQADAVRTDLFAGRIGAAVLPASALLRQSGLFGASAVPFLAGTASEAAALDRVVAPLYAARLAENGLAQLALLAMRPVALRCEATPTAATAVRRRIVAESPAGVRLAELTGADASPGAPEVAAAAGVDSRSRGSGGNRTGTASAVVRFEALAPSQMQAAGASVAWWPRAIVVAREDMLARIAPDDRAALTAAMAAAAARIGAAWAGRAEPPGSSGAGDEAGRGQSAGAAVNPRDGGAAAASVNPRDGGAAAAAASADIAVPPAARHGAAAGVPCRDFERDLRQAARLMVREWAVGAGADGFAVLKEFGWPPSGAGAPPATEPVATGAARQSRPQ